MMVVVLLNLQFIQDGPAFGPLMYLRKQKLKALGMPDDYVYDIVELITPVGTRHVLGENISNPEFIRIIQELIDVTCDAMTDWAEPKSLYRRF
jgi:hypothetical protein